MKLKTYLKHPWRPSRKFNKKENNEELRWSKPKKKNNKRKPTTWHQAKMSTLTSNSWSKKISSDKKSSLLTHATVKPNLQSMSESDPFSKSKKLMGKLTPFLQPTRRSRSTNQSTKSTELPNTLKIILLLSTTLSMKRRPQMTFTRQRWNLCCQVSSREELWPVLHTAKRVQVRLLRWMDSKNRQLKNFSTLRRKDLA